MTTAQLADFMLTGGRNDSLSTYANRLALRMFSYPSVMLSLHKMQVEEGDGTKVKPHVELVFRAIPAEMLETVKGVIGNDDPMDTYAFRSDRDHPMLGIRVYPRHCGDKRTDFGLS